MSEPRLFISYATDDAVGVGTYLVAFEECGLSVWIDNKQIEASDDLVRRINEGLSNTKYAVIFYSQRYAAKNWTNAEMNALIYAAVAANDRRVFVVQLDATALPPLLASRLAFRQTSPKDAAGRIAEIVHTNDRGESVPRPALTPGSDDKAGRVPQPAPDPVKKIDLQDLDPTVVENLARDLVAEPAVWKLARRQQAAVDPLVVDLGRFGTSRVVLRSKGASQEALLDLQSELNISSTHREYIRHLRDDLAVGGLGIITPAFKITLERRMTELDQTRERIRDYVAAIILKIELLDEKSSEPGSC